MSNRKSMYERLEHVSFFQRLHYKYFSKISVKEKIETVISQLDEKVRPDLVYIDKEEYNDKINKEIRENQKDNGDDKPIDEIKAEMPSIAWVAYEIKSKKPIIYIDKRYQSARETDFLILHELGHLYFNTFSLGEIGMVEKHLYDSMDYFLDQLEWKGDRSPQTKKFFVDMFSNKIINLASDMEIHGSLFTHEEYLHFVINVANFTDDILYMFCHPASHKLPENLWMLDYAEYIMEHPRKFFPIFTEEIQKQLEKSACQYNPGNRPQASSSMSRGKKPQNGKNGQNQPQSSSQMKPNNKHTAPQKSQENQSDAQEGNQDTKGQSGIQSENNSQNEQPQSNGAGQSTGESEKESPEVQNGQNQSDGNHQEGDQKEDDNKSEQDQTQSKKQDGQSDESKEELEVHGEGVRDQDRLDSIEASQNRNMDMSSEIKKDSAIDAHKDHVQDANDEQAPHEGASANDKSASAGTSREVNATIQPPKVMSPLDKLQKFIQEHIQTQKVDRIMERDVMYNTNRGRLGRRSDVIRPAHVMKIRAKQKEEATAVFLVDVSGSMNSRILTRIIKTIYSFRSKTNITKDWRVVTWNSGLVQDFSLSNEEGIKIGGGTAIAYGIDYCKKYIKSRSDKLFIISDMEDSLSDWADEIKANSAMTKDNVFVIDLPTSKYAEPLNQSLRDSDETRGWGRNGYVRDLLNVAHYHFIDAYSTSYHQSTLNDIGGNVLGYADDED